MRPWDRNPGLRGYVLPERKDTMSVMKYVVFASQYDSEADAKADFEAVRRLYEDLKIVDTYDAAVITKKPDGKVDIVKVVEEPTRKGAAAGLVTGLALGAVAAL